MSSRARQPGSKAAASASAGAKASSGTKKGASKGKKTQKNGTPATESKAESPPPLDDSQQDMDVDPEDVAFDGPGFDPSNSRLYCVCLGTDDGSPMLQCEGCNNWFHFRCIDLTPAAAMNIDSYFCEICTEVGAGMTQLKPPRRAQQVDQEPPNWYDDDAFEAQQPQNSQLWDADFTLEDAEDVSGAEGQGKKRKVLPPKTVSASEFFKQPATAQRKKRKQKAEGMSSDDDTDDEDFDYDEVAGSRKRAAPKAQPKSRPAPQKSASGSQTAKASSSGKKESGSAKAQATAAAATRKQCTGTLIKVLEPVFAPSAGNATNAHARAEEFANEVEAQVFEHFSDPGQQPKQKYLTKIRQLLFNLKTSELLRTRVALGRIPPAKLANLSMDELLTPEQRAMADSVRAKSLKNSVKQDMDTNQPRIRMTHKGQEVVGEDQSSARTFSAGSPRSPDKSSFEAERQAGSESREGSMAQSPTGPAQMGQSLSPGAQSPQLGRSQTSPRPEEDGAFDARAHSPVADQSQSPEEAPTTASVEEKPRPRVQFDFDSVWGSLQSPPAATPQLDTIGTSGPESPLDVSQAADAKADDDVYDPFDFGRADDAPVSTTPPLSPRTTAQPPAPPKAPAVDPCVAIQGFSQIWSGDVFMPDEGGFPARAVQVGGRPLGDAPLVWQSLVPSRMAIEGRLPTKNATDYLVQCSFAPTREIVILALMPNAANGLTLEQAQEKQQYFIDMFVRRDRNGVVPPAPHRRQLVKDCYIVPLKASDDMLPEYIELLDEHALGDKGERKSDLLLAVFVLQKGILPSIGVNQAQSTSAIESASTPIPAITSAQPAVSGYASPFPVPAQSQPPPPSSFGSVPAPPPAAAPPTSFDPSALSSLINPDLLASLVANASAAAQQGSNQSHAPIPHPDPYYHAPPPHGSMPPPYAQRHLADDPPYESRYHDYRDRPPPRAYPPYDDREGDRGRSPPLRRGRDRSPPGRGPPRGGRGRGGFQGDNGYRGRRGPPRGR